MATLKTVNGKVTGPDGSVRSWGRVFLAISQPAVVVGSQEVVQGAIGANLSTADGSWSASLYSNSDLSPSGTTYQMRQVTDLGTSVYTIVVPSSAGPFNASSLIS